MLIEMDDRRASLRVQGNVPALEKPPSLTNGVELVGKLQGSGFAQEQWLVRREGRFVQLTELLYRVAEVIDGRRTVEEIAAVVSRSSPWLVSAEQVALLIDKKLTPLGLIVAEGGGAASTLPAAGSALGLHTRLGVVPESTVNALAKPLRWLFWPPLVVVLVALIGASHAWLFAARGISDSVLQLLYAPALILVLLLLLVLAGIVHELGHAAALVYGGGRVGAMGVGLFLVYPALFTDVTDSYRLSRAGRLRTDLGGIYFHLLAALGIIGLYLLTDQPFLLLAVLLIDVEIVRQLIPFLRLDGYWVLSDLAGVPDLFSQMGPFIRSLLGSRGGEGQRLPTLRRAPRIAFLLFIAMTIPALLVLTFVLVGGVPALVAAASDATLHQLGQLAEAREHGRADGVALALLQLALAVLPLAVTVYLIVLVGRRLLAGLVGWGRVNPRRALTAGLTGVGAAAVLGILWIPQLPFLASAPGDVQTFAVAGRSHVQGSVAYEQRPPVGGDHAPIWQNCGFYDAPIADENVVHSLEHGAVWIAYRPESPDDQKARLRSIAYSQIHILVSPYDGLSAPVVATAWGRQLALDGPDDPRLRQFIRAFRLAATAPERGGSCTDGVGTPR